MEDDKHSVGVGLAAINKLITFSPTYALGPKDKQLIRMCDSDLFIAASIALWFLKIRTKIRP